MAVYVDDVRHRFGNMVMCHLWADTDDELLAMVDKIGVQRKWIQGHKTLSFGKHRDASWVHFDIALSKSARDRCWRDTHRQIRTGGSYQPSKDRLGKINNRHDVVERAEAMIQQIEELRTARGIMAEEANYSKE